MRTLHFLPAAVLIAACSGDPFTPVNAPDPVNSAARTALQIAVDDGLTRLVPGLAADASAPVSSALQTLALRLREPSASASSVNDALATIKQTLATFDSSDRSDAATLDALALELAAR